MIKNLSETEIEMINGAGPGEEPPLQGWWDRWWRPWTNDPDELDS